MKRSLVFPVSEWRVGMLACAFADVHETKFFFGGERGEFVNFQNPNEYACVAFIQDQEAICLQMSMLVFKKQYGLRCPTSRKQIFW